MLINVLVLSLKKLTLKTPFFAVLEVIGVGGIYQGRDLLRATYQM